MTAPPLETRTMVRVFIGSPGDVPAQRAAVREAAAFYNRAIGPHHRIVVECRDWTKDTWPEHRGTIQEGIDDQIGPYDVFIGIFGARLGTPVAGAASGTVHEFERALAKHAEHGRPIPMLYFHKGAITWPELEDVDQLRGVLEFEARVKDSGVSRHYEDPYQFGLLVLEHLTKLITDKFLPHITADRAAEQSPPTGDDDEDADEGTAELLGLRLSVEMKLAWICKHLLAGPHTATYATIGSLRYDRFLTEDQALLLTRVMVGRPPSRDARENRAFADQAQRTVRTLRLIVFQEVVRRRLREDGWTVEALTPARSSDFLATKGKLTFRVAPRIITRDGSRVREQTAARLARATDEPRPVENRLIVMPDVSAATSDPGDASPRAVKLAELLSL